MEKCFEKSLRSFAFWAKKDKKNWSLSYERSSASWRLTKLKNTYVYAVCFCFYEKCLIMKLKFKKPNSCKVFGCNPVFGSLIFMMLGHPSIHLAPPPRGQWAAAWQKRNVPWKDSSSTAPCTPLIRVNYTWRNVAINLKR